MSESINTPNQDSTLAVTLTVGQLRELIREEVQAALLGVSRDWIYRNASRLPFTRKLGPKMLRFSYQGVLKWLPSRKLS